MKLVQITFILFASTQVVSYGKVYCGSRLVDFVRSECKAIKYRRHHRSLKYSVMIEDNGIIQSFQSRKSMAALASEIMLEHDERNFETIEQAYIPSFLQKIAKKHLAKRIAKRRRMRRGIVDKCCYSKNGCTRELVRNYCS